MKDFGQSERIRTTVKEIARLDGRDVIEFGSTDFSFRPLLKSRYARHYESWMTVDIAEGADIHVDLNAPSIHLPLGERTADIVICTEVLEHLLWPQALLAEVRRILRPAGHLLCSVPNIVSLTYRLKFLFGGLPSCAARANLPAEMNGIHYFNEASVQFGGHVVDFNEATLRRLLEYAALDCVRLTGTGLIWGRTILPAKLCPTSLSSNLLAVARARL